MNKILEWLKIRIHHFTGKEYICFCPFHKQGQEKHPSFGVNEEGLWCCFTCGRGGNVIQLVSALLDIDDQKAIKALEKRKFDPLLRTLIDIPEWENRFPKHRDEILSENILKLYPRKQVAIEYIMNRDIGRRIRDEFEVGYDRWMKRVTFPVRNYKRELVGIVGRTLDNNRFPRYMFYSFKKSHFLYGLHNYEDTNHLIVVEGIIDLLYLRNLGWNNSVALMGSKMSEIQRNLIANSAEEVTLFLDNDEGGIDGTERAIKMLKDYVKLYFVDWRIRMKDTKDPADLNFLGIKEMLDNRKFFLEWKGR